MSFVWRACAHALATQMFSVLSCRSSSVNIFWIFAAKFCGKFGGEFCRIFSGPQKIGSKTSGKDRGNETIYLHRSGPLLANGPDRPKNRYGRYGFPSFYSISISTVGLDEARVFL